MLSENENKYFEKWTTTQKNQQFHKRVIMSLIALIGILSVVIILSSNSSPLVVERENSIYRALSIVGSEVKPSKESVEIIIEEFVRARYEWEAFVPQSIIKNLEPYTTDAFQTKLFEEFGKKGFQNKPGESIEQVVARIKPNVSEKAVLATFDRILRINGIPVVVPTEISLMLSEGPKTFFNPIGLYINGLIEHESR
jgi:hypothetical protein